MKKILPFILFLIVPCLMMAQSFSDNFDSYKAGDQLAKTNFRWSTWNGMPGTDEDGVISDAHAASAPNSLEIKGSSDVIYNFEELTHGRYLISFNYFIPTGSNGGYFNCLHEYGNAETSIWAFECFFHGNGTGYLKINNEDHNFTAVANEWFPVLLDINIDEDSVALTINDKFVMGWPFHYAADGTGLYDKLAVIDFYASAPDEAAGHYFVDDFEFREAPVAVNDYNAPQVTIFPNPTSSQINISADQMTKVELYNMVGQKVYDTECTDNVLSIPTYGLTSGAYIVKVISNNGITNKKVVVK